MQRGSYKHGIAMMCLRWRSDAMKRLEGGEARTYTRARDWYALTRLQHLVWAKLISDDIDNLYSDQ
jgi:hypothetical protein